MDRQRDTPVRRGDTAEVDADRNKYPVSIGGTQPADILSSLLSGGGDTMTSPLIPHTEQVTPSIDSSDRGTGSHGIACSVGQNIAETQEVKKDRSQVHETVQVLHKQSPTPVLIIKDREEATIPDSVPAIPAEGDLQEQQEDNMDPDVHDGQVSRKQQDPPIQELSTPSVPEPSIGGKSFVSVRGVKVAGPGGHGGIPRRGECQHQRGGYCLLHGGGAKKHTRWVNKTTSSPGGTKINKASKQTYYVCNLDKNTVAGSLRQTQLSFTDTRGTKEAAKEDTMGGDSFATNFSSSTVGQCDETEMSILPGSGR